MDFDDLIVLGKFAAFPKVLLFFSTNLTYQTLKYLCSLFSLLYENKWECDYHFFIQKPIVLYFWTNDFVHYYVTSLYNSPNNFVRPYCVHDLQRHVYPKLKSMYSHASFSSMIFHGNQRALCIFIRCTGKYHQYAQSYILLHLTKFHTLCQKLPWFLYYICTKVHS